MTIKKGRIWQCIVYPESAPDNWQEIVEDLRLDGFISPIHDKDTNPDHTMKKEHYHVLLMWDGPTTEKNARAICESFGGVMEPIPVQSLTGAVRYLIHMDNPEKYQYKKKDVVELGVADFISMSRKSQISRNALKEIFQFIDKHNIYAYAQLVRFAALHDDVWLDVLVNRNTYAVNEYLKSKSWQAKKENQELVEEGTSSWFIGMLEPEFLDDGRVVNIHTGEVLVNNLREGDNHESTD